MTGGTWTRSNGNYLRVRGEYAVPAIVPFTPWELPPRARRILVGGIFLCGHAGTTSACAENTMLRKPGFRRTRNYLRVRGEYDLPRPRKHQGKELPPRARRIPWGASHGFHRGGTTSACAENTGDQGAWGASHGNYLRVRGEYCSRCMLK